MPLVQIRDVGGQAVTADDLRRMARNTGAA